MKGYMIYQKFYKRFNIFNTYFGWYLHKLMARPTALDVILSTETHSVPGSIQALRWKYTSFHGN